MQCLYESLYHILEYQIQQKSKFDAANNKSFIRQSFKAAASASGPHSIFPKDQRLFSQLSVFQAHTQTAFPIKNL
jgi:hypothetical protein